MNQAMLDFFEQVPDAARIVVEDGDVTFYFFGSPHPWSAQEFMLGTSTRAILDAVVKSRPEDGDYQAWHR